jgi:hypothetical protein
MTADDAKQFVKLLAGLFPNQLTQDQARFAADRFKVFEPGDVRKAIAAHRETHEFINWPQLFEGCRATAKAKEQGAEYARREGTWADVYRRQNPKQLAGASNVEVALRVHRGWWFRCGKSDSHRKQFHYSCRMQLLANGMGEEDAERWAETVFNDDAAYFARVLQEVREFYGKRPESAEAEQDAEAAFAGQAVPA